MEIRRIGDTVDLLGESCVWSERDQALFWTDVRGKMVRRLDYASGYIESFPVPEMVGSLAIREKGGLVLAMQTSVSLFDPDSGELAQLALPHEDFAGLRFNDGRCDRQGRFWTGTMNDVDRGKQGTLYRLGAERELAPVLCPLTIPNSLSWSPDGKKMYFSDTTSRTIIAYDFEPETGMPSNGREFARVAGPGTPDGSTVDAEGYLWNAEYDGWKVTRYAPDGRVDRVVEVPLRRPTCCAFGGPDLKTLFVTTAAQHLDDAERMEQPLAGGLLALDVGVRGLAEPCYAG